MAGYLLKLNGFSTSAVYPCDYREVVTAENALATRRWERQTDDAKGADRAATPTGNL